MKNIKKLLVFALIVSILSLCFSLSMAETEPAAIRVASMKGPTSMGMVKLMIDDSESATAQDYEFTVAGAANEIVPMIAQGTIDIALIPCNLASTLYNNTGKIEVAAVNVLGVLYIVENGETVQSIEDLRGATIFSTGKGTTPEYGLRHVLSKAGIDPDKDVTIEYKSEAAEVLAAIKSGLEDMLSVSGRLEPLPTGNRGFSVLLDYAHTPDALENILKTVRGFAKGNIVTVFGCGGDRDRVKRPIMGEIAGRFSDYLVVTSDNPRTEDPFAIIEAIVEGVKRSGCEYITIENRKDAILYALTHAEKDDVIILAGKGHENYQEINGVKHHFDEKEIVAELLETIPE